MRVGNSQEIQQPLDITILTDLTMECVKDSIWRTLDEHSGYIMADLEELACQPVSWPPQGNSALKCVTLRLQLSSRPPKPALSLTITHASLRQLRQRGEFPSASG